ncbi:MAG: hypothetical protein ACSLE0_00145 [Chitinophagaceae bacterium]
MKKQFISFICAGVVSMLTINLSFAQEESFKELPPITISASTSNVSARVNKSFNQYFKGASYQRWYQLDKNFLVKFIQNEQENRALFTKNGSLIYHISYGTEKHLPANVRGLVKSNYYDQNITRVLKVNQDRRNIWVISMEDAKDIVMVRVEDMELEETQRMHKTN